MSLEKIISVYRPRSRGYSIDNAAGVFPRIMLGPGCYLDTPTILRNSITHIVNCAEDAACPESAKHFIKNNYVCLNAIDHPEYPILQMHYKHFETVMDTFLRDPKCKQIYVHCQAGINRSACLVIAYVCKKFGVPLLRLVENVAMQRPCILTNPGFQKQLLEFK